MLSPSIIGDIEELYLSGWSSAKLGKKYQRHHTTILYYIHRKIYKKDMKGRVIHPPRLPIRIAVLPKPKTYIDYLRETADREKRSPFYQIALDYYEQQSSQRKSPSSE